MLVLSRRSADAVRLVLPNGDEIVLTILDGSCRLGIDAPDSVEIVRGELTD